MQWIHLMFKETSREETQPTNSCLQIRVFFVSLHFICFACSGWAVGFDQKSFRDENLLKLLAAEYHWDFFIYDCGSCFFLVEGHRFYRNEILFVCDNLSLSWEKASCFVNKFSQKKTLHCYIHKHTQKKTKIRQKFLGGALYKRVWVCFCSECMT